MTQALLVVGGLFLLIYVPLAMLAWRRPLLARFAWREATRRRGQFALLVVGLMVGSASITASLVAADSGVQTLGSLTYERLGAVDMTVTAARGNSFPRSVASELASDPTLTPYIDGVQAGVERQASLADLDRRLGKPEVLLVGFDVQSQRRFGAFSLTDGRRTYGEELAAGDVLLSQGLARALDAKVGDRLRIAAGSESDANLRLYGIATPTGPGAYGGYLAVFMTLESSERIVHDPGINIVRIAARGSSATDPTPASRAAGPVRSAVSRMDAGTPLLVNEVRPYAATWLTGMTQGIFGELLAPTSLTILAAIALIVNLVLALAEERRSRLAVLRALGLTRTGLVVLSILEGAIYSIAAAAVGVAAGVPAGLYLANQLWIAATIDPLDQAWLGYPLQFAVRPGTLALALAAGALIAIGTVAGAAYRTSRIAIAAAIRDLPEPASRPRRPRLRIALVLFLGALSAGLLIPSDTRTHLIGGVALIAVMGALARGRLSDRVRFTLTGVFVAGWAAVVATSVPGGRDLYEVVTTIFLVAASGAAGLSIAAAANLRLIDLGVGLGGRRAGRLQATLRPPLAYLSRRPVRTGLAITAFAMVLVLVSGIAFLTAAPKPSYARDSAGYDITVVTSGPNPIQLPLELQQDVAGEMALTMRSYTGSIVGQPWSTPAMFFILPDEPSDGGPVYLHSYAKGFGRSGEVWRALRADPHLAVDAQSGLGDDVAFEGATGPVALHVVGHEGPTVLQGLIVSRAAVADLPTEPAGTTLLIKARSGVDPRSLSRQIERALFDQGVQATGIRDILDQGYESGADYVTEYDVLIHMGLLVGVLALAMIGIRAAIDRRRTIGVLRALGYQPVQVLGGLVSESIVMTTIGAMTGITAGVVLAYALVSGVSGFEALDTANWSGPVTRLGVALALVYATVLIVTVPLAARAARMAPAEAIRLPS